MAIDRAGLRKLGIEVGGYGGYCEGDGLGTDVRFDDGDGVLALAVRNGVVTSGAGGRGVDGRRGRDGVESTEDVLSERPCAGCVVSGGRDSRCGECASEGSSGVFVANAIRIKRD